MREGGTAEGSGRLLKSVRGTERLGRRGRGGCEGDLFCSSSSPSAVRRARRLRRAPAETAAERSGTSAARVQIIRLKKKKKGVRLGRHAAHTFRQQVYSLSIYTLKRLRTEEQQRELRARRTPRSLGSQVAIAKVGCERSRSIDAVAKIRENIGDDEFSYELSNHLRKMGGGRSRGRSPLQSPPDRGGDRPPPRSPPHFRRFLKQFDENEGRSQR